MIIVIGYTFFYFYWLKKNILAFAYVKTLYYNRIYVSERTDINKSNKSNKCRICHYWYFENVGYKYEPCVSNRCHDVSMMAYEL